MRWDRGFHSYLLFINSTSSKSQLFALHKSPPLENILLTRLGFEVCLVDRAFLSWCNLRFCMCVHMSLYVFEYIFQQNYLYNAIIESVLFDLCSSFLCPSCTACSSTWASPLSMVFRWVHAAQRVSCYRFAEKDPNPADLPDLRWSLGTRPIPEHDLGSGKSG